MLFASTLLLPARVEAQGEGPRVYLMAPVGINALSATYMDLSSNMNFAQSILLPNADVTSEILALNYNRFFDIGGRFAELWVTGIFGSVDGGVPGTPLGDLSASESGFSDPYLALRVGLIGAPALKPAEFANYKQGFQMHALAGVLPPLGDYDSKRVLNLGTNRWSYRLGLPMVLPFGQAPKPTYLEIVPNVYFYGDNDDPLGAEIREQDPLFVLETHLTHNFTPRFWAGIGLRYQLGGETTTDGVSNDNRVEQLGGDLELGYQFNQSFSGFLTYGEIIEQQDGSEGEMWRARGVYAF
ncbi:MAG: transporter [Pseudomonadota bacterium]|nr:transporter [Pseudomonadota bacterium]